MRVLHKLHILLIRFGNIAYTAKFTIHHYERAIYSHIPHKTKASNNFISVIAKVSGTNNVVGNYIRIHYPIVEYRMESLKKLTDLFDSFLFDLRSVRQLLKKFAS